MDRYNKKRKSGGRNKDTGLAAVTAGAGILLVLILAVAIGIFINNSKKQREEVEAEIAAWEELESPGKPARKPVWEIPLTSRIVP